MDAPLIPFLALAIVALVVLALVLAVIDVDITQTRRIEKQVARDVRRIRLKVIKGWSDERISERYPDLPAVQIARVRHAMQRHLQASEEVDLLRSLWMIDIPEPDHEG